MTMMIELTIFSGERVAIALPLQVFKALPGAPTDEIPARTRVYVPHVDYFDVRESYEEILKLINLEVEEEGKGEPR